MMRLTARQIFRLAARMAKGNAAPPSKARRALNPKTIADRITRVNAWHAERAVECGPWEVWLRLRTHNRANGGHGNHFAIARERKRIREATYYQVGGSRPRLPTVVKLTRYGPGKSRRTRFGVGAMDEDGLLNSLKSVRDGVADAYDVEDDDPRIAFDYWQEIAPPGCHGVRVSFSRPRTSQRRKGK